MCRSILFSLVSTICLSGLISVFQPACALMPLSDRSINEAVQYGLENQETGLSTFLGSNWKEGQDGALLNIYTPFIEIARFAAKRQGSPNPSPEKIAEVRHEIRKDIDYIWQHPTVKFMVSLYGDNPSFAKNLYAMIEGVGRGRTYRLYPAVSIPQYLATQEKGVDIKPYAAINAYHFKFEDIEQLDEYELKLYGKGITPITFKILNKGIR